MQIEEPHFMSYPQDNSSHSSLVHTPFSLNLSKLKPIKKIGESKFPVLLVYSPELDKYCALKLFPFKDNKISSAYINESRFHVLSHQNIVSTIAVNDKQKSTAGNKLFYCSCILMDYAPFGDFSELLIKYKLFQAEVLIRTFFHQFISGLEYLHSNEIAHLDLKLENLLLGEDLSLKITDFDMAHSIDDIGIRGKGTGNYRAPEIQAGKCKNTKAADIYSAGIILFAFLTGTFPYMEDSLVQGHELFELMVNDPEKFWKIHEDILKERVQLSQEFKELFLSMVQVDPLQRATLENIKSSKWYQGPTYSLEGLYFKLCEYGVIQNNLITQTD